MKKQTGTRCTKSDKRSETGRKTDGKQTETDRNQTETDRNQTDNSQKLYGGNALSLILKKAESRNEVEAVFELYRERIAWMNREGIAQWNTTDYLESYPVTYYLDQMEQGNLYVLENDADGTAAGAVVLLPEDERWADRADTQAYYIHNLVTSYREKGLGSILLEEMERIAIEDQKQFLRLDCAVDNRFLNAYYESRGFLPAGTCEDGSYRGNRREKALSKSK